MPSPRKFDWDEAARLYAETRNYAEVARRLGVSMQAVRRALIPEVRDRMSVTHAKWQSETKPWIGVCPDCGGPASNGRGQRERCRDCHAKSMTTSVRPDTLRCSCCRLWLPDESFPRRQAAVQRRGRHQICTPCGRIMKRDWRVANRDRERAKDRERKRAQRALQRASA